MTDPQPAAAIHPWSHLPLPEGAGLRALADGTAIGRYLRMDLASVFQPLIDGGGACVGHEAFVRAHGRGDLGLTPWGLFSLADEGRALVALDRLCRIVHTLNFLRADPAGKLFMNVHGRLLAAVAEDHGRAFRRILDLLAFAPGRVVIEIPPTANENRRLLALALANYRRHGFAVAINVAGPAALPALLRAVQTDYVKIDGRGASRPELMRTAAELARASGARPVFTRIETAQQRDFLLAQPGVLLQGRAIAAPHPLPR